MVLFLLKNKDLQDAEVTSLLEPNLVPSTVHRWMIKAGAKFDADKKSYYTDRHDTPQNIKDRNERYLPFQDKLQSRTFNWVEQ